MKWHLLLGGCCNYEWYNRGNQVRLNKRDKRLAIVLCLGCGQKLISWWNMISCSAKPISAQKNKGRTRWTRCFCMHDCCHSVQFLLMLYRRFFTSATWHMSGIPLSTTRRNLSNLGAETLSWLPSNCLESCCHSVRLYDTQENRITGLVRIWLDF